MEGVRAAESYSQLVVLKMLKMLSLALTPFRGREVAAVLKLRRAYFLLHTYTHTHTNYQDVWMHSLQP